MSVVLLKAAVNQRCLNHSKACDTLTSKN